MKLEKVEVELFGKKYFRWQARWKTFDQKMITVASPLYEEENTPESCAAFQEFVEMKKRHLLKHPEQN